MDLNTWRQHLLARARTRIGDLTASPATDTKPDSFDVLLNVDGGCGHLAGLPADEPEDFALSDLVFAGGSARCR